MSQRLTLASPSLLLFTCLLLAPLSALAASPSVTEFDEVLEAVVSSKDTGEALAQAMLIPSLQERVPTAHARQALTQAIERATDPQVKVALELQRVQASQELGDWADGPGGMSGPLAKAGCLTNFRLLGPFSNDANEGFFSELPPQTGEAGPYAGKSAEIDWRPLPPFVSGCALNLDVSIEQDEDSVAFLATQVTSDKAQKAHLMLGASGSYTVWLNGKPVARRAEDAGLRLDTDAWNLSLKKGMNQLVIKLASSEGHGLDLVARLTDSKNVPFSLESAGAWDGKKLADASTFSTKPLPDGALAHAKKLAAGPASREALLGAWLWSGSERRNAATPWRDVADKIDAALATKSLTLSAREHRMLASLYEEHWKRLDVLERGVAAHPDDPQLLYALADEYQRSDTSEKELARKKLLTRLVASHPDYLPGTVALANLWRGDGFPHKALELLESKKSAENLKILDYTRALISTLEHLDRLAEADALREQLFATHALSASASWYRIQRHLVRNELDEALALTRAERERQPWSNHWFIKEADILRAKGDVEGALALMAQRLEKIPQDRETLIKKADLQIAAGQRDEARETLDRALATRPQDQELRDYLAFLQPDTDRFHESWMQEELRPLSDKMPAGPFHASTIVDQTIVRVTPNGLSQSVTQQVARINTRDGIDDASIIRIPFQSGDERVDILRVRVLKEDGSVSEDYDIWRSDDSRKASTTYNDNGTVTLRANNAEPGDIVEFRYRVSQIANRNFRGDYFGDIEYVQGTEPIGLYRYAVLYPDSMGKLFFRPPRLEHTRLDDIDPSGHKLEPGYKGTAFEVRDVPYVKTDSDQPGYTDVYDYIMVSNKETYNEIGHWWWNLVKEQLIVDENIRKTVADLTRGLKTDDQKLRAIHNYVVQNTRYLHVGLGIHGWKPYRTSTCLRNRYGDCKDKAALLKVMLETAGIPTNLVLVRTRRLGSVGDYPASMHIFNHAIAYVPGMDLFLDGTAEFNGTRELTTMDQGAQALIIEDGGTARWVTLPVDRPEANELRQEITIDLTGEEPRTLIKLTATGANAVYYRTALEDPDRRDELIESQLNAVYQGASLVKATYSDLKKLEQPVSITLELKGGQILRQSDANAYLYPLGSPKDLLGAYAQQSSRDQDLSIRVPFANATTVRYKLPKGKTVGKLPQGKTLKSPFGSLDIEYQDSNETVTVEARYSLDVQRVTTSEYQDFRGFMRDVTGTLNETIQLF